MRSSPWEPTWSQDTIARRFALTIMAAVTVAAVLSALVVSLASAWLATPANDAGLLQTAISITHALEAAPPALRSTLAAAAATKIYGIEWHPADDPLAAMLRQGTGLDDLHPVEGAWLNDLTARSFVFYVTAGSPAAALLRHDFTPEERFRFLGVRLKDDSWLVYAHLDRTRDAVRAFRIGIALILLLLSAAAVSLVAARQLSRPIERIADAARHFGTNPQAPPIAESGPRELRGVIRAFNAMQGQIQKFVGYRTAMLAAISHDLRTPLTRMRLRGEFVEDAEQQARLFRDVDEMQAMVDGALAFFRDDADEEAVTAFDLGGLLTTIADEYADQGVAVAYEGPSHAVYRGRPFALKRAVTNLIENAVKHATPPAMTLEQVLGEQVPETVAIVVRDHGPGIPEDALEQVFSPFFRLDRSRNRVTGGVGLGLTAALAIVRGHGGDITLTNRPGGGLEARVTLPTA
ncbi:integral membrane sensor signal transduction histidine kinase [Nitrospirillum viridazoti Y2]|uniref:histidine kinase n=1 Tax=Nitrospirillum amazonense TaxID=28077 RepID=A0A560HMJ8_9PROT|nr:ATP-binding protein [Nitrospirillum amazonense]EGY02231.1 integral membrane sensor signal transduction histidine kinase [Nitrospirillum amazonense Y2]TWB47772.1 signal transduction histidine kinase [Nitrospirillum amazonense]